MSEMRFSAWLGPWSWSEEDDQPLIRWAVEHAIEADRDGFAAVFMPEHHFNGYSVVGADALMMAAYLAPQLQQAHIGFAVQVVPLMHPVALVERFNLLDQLTRGRCLFGVGSGVEIENALAFGLADSEGPHFNNSDQIMEVATRLWEHRLGDPPLSFDTGVYRGTLLQRIVPSPYRRPRPLLMRAGIRDGQLSAAATAGWPVFVWEHDSHEAFSRRLRHYHAALAAAAHPPEIVEECLRWTSAMRTIVAVADTREEAREQMMFVLERHERFVQRMRAYIATAGEITGMAPMERGYRSRKDPQYVANWFLYGTAEEVAEQIRSCYADKGVRNLVTSFAWGIDDDAQCRSLFAGWYRRFVDEVMPRFVER